MDSYIGIFNQICDLACELEDTHLHPRVRQRLCHAFDRAICKALAINFSYDVPDADYVQRSVFRHAERGARDFVA
jgi:hypothetical protein